MPEPEPGFTVTALAGLTGPVLECAGALDLDQVPVPRAALHQALALRPAPPVLLVDLAAVTFMDSSGLSALLHARRDAERTGAVVRLARLPHRVARILEITGADQVFAAAPDIPGAVPLDEPTRDHRCTPVPAGSKAVCARTRGLC